MVRGAKGRRGRAAGYSQVVYINIYVWYSSQKRRNERRKKMNEMVEVATQLAEPFLGGRMPPQHKAFHLERFRCKSHRDSDSVRVPEPSCACITQSQV